MSRGRHRREPYGAVLVAVMLVAGGFLALVVWRGTPLWHPDPPPTPAPVVVEQCAPWSWTDGAGQIWHGCR